MRFIVENFGPIEKADIMIKDLNVFIGKNSTGKSYLAYLIWCFLAVEPDWNKLRELVDKYVPSELISKVIEEKTTEEELTDLTYKISKGIERLIFEVFENFDSIWGRNLEELIKDVFLVDSLKELIRSGKDTAKILVCNGDCTMKIHVEI
jgi:predicted ATPase